MSPRLPVGVRRLARIVPALVVLATGCAPADTPEDQQAVVGVPADPWALPAPPPQSVYSGPLFTLSHDYPEQPVAPPDPAPWREAIGGGEITVENAGAYVQALKDYIAADMKVLLFDYPDWNPGEAGWYNQPWLVQREAPLPGPLREPIHGTYVGSTFPSSMFPRSGLTETMTTHVAVYYDAVAAGSLQKVWGRGGLDPLPGLESGGAQFPEGGIIVKPAFASVDAAAWPPLEGAFPWTIWTQPGDGTSGDPVLKTVYLFQFDIIVKDSLSAPKTGWVFSTLVYDGSAAGDDWEKMVPLGAMWGNDPDVVSPADCDYLTPGSCPPLSETWVDAGTPVYARETLGWGGRLSGPNDGAVDVSAVVKSNGELTMYEGRYAMSSCMSCHGAAEYQMSSFLLPSPAKCADDRCTPTFAKCTDGACEEVPPGPGADLVYFASGSQEFRNWFQDRAGDEPMDEGAIALDYGMNYAFKALPQWFDATGQAGRLSFIEEFNNYRGLRFDDTQ